MLNRTLLAILSATLVSASLVAAGEDARLRVTHRNLVPVCLNGAATQASHRSWQFGAEPQTLVLTMRNQPRSGIHNADPGLAQITFTPEPGHVYELEVRAEPEAYSFRVWQAGHWSPVVRDRTTDQIVSSAPVWKGSCEG